MNELSTSISMTELNEFAGLYGDGNVTGNNSGVFPDEVICRAMVYSPAKQQP